MRHSFLIAAAMATLLFASCSGGGDKGAVPLPIAYPRISTADSVYRDAGLKGINIEFNDAAVVALDSVLPSGSAWLTVKYPAAYGDARLYVTISADATPEAVANRRQRIDLNSGGMPTELTTVGNAGGISTEIYHTPSGSATPLQFLSVGSGGRMVSGVFFLEAASSKADSVRPVVESVKADLIHLAKTLR